MMGTQYTRVGGDQHAEALGWQQGHRSLFSASAASEKGSTLQCGSRVPWILDQVHILLSHGIPASKATAATSPNSLMDTHRLREAEGYCGTKEGNKTRGTQVNVHSWCIGRCHNGHQSASTNCPRSPCQPTGLTFSLSHVTLSLRPP